MFQPIKCSSRTLTLLFCYPVFAIGQYMLFTSAQKMPLLSDRLHAGSAGWINAHLLLILSLFMIIKGYLAISDYVRPTPGGWMASLAVFLTALSIFVLFGQYIIDLVLVEVYKLPDELAEQTLSRLRSNSVLGKFFSGQSLITHFFWVIDLPFIANALMGTAMAVSGKVPRWSVWLFFLAFFLTNFSVVIFPAFGSEIRIWAYAIFSISFYPIAIGLWKKPVVSPVMASAGQEKIAITVA